MTDLTGFIHFPQIDIDASRELNAHVYERSNTEINSRSSVNFILPLKAYF